MMLKSDGEAGTMSYSTVDGWMDVESRMPNQWTNVTPCCDVSREEREMRWDISCSESQGPISGTRGPSKPKTAKTGIDDVWGSD